MAKILKNNPLKEDVLKVIDSSSHFIQNDEVILSMSDLKYWFSKYENLSDFIYVDDLMLCEVEEGEEVYSEEQTKIFI